MALIFHEGIPGCGKTYEAVVKHLVPALSKGRHVYARINGLNYEQLATLACVTLERCQDLLHHIDEDQVKFVDQIAIPIGSLVIIDELQNYFPDSRAKLTDGITKFVAEQRHKGLDIVAMGQDLKDVHKIWRRRVDQKVLFHKLDMLGLKKYRWKLYKAIGPEKFKDVSSGEESYDKAVFGSYKSFEEGAEAAQKYDDARANIWSSRLFRRVLPFFLIVGFFSIYYVYHLFTGGGLAHKLGGSGAITSTVPTAKPPVGILSPVASASVAADKSVVDLPKKKYQRDFIEDLCEKYRPRISGVIWSEKKITAIIEWYDESLHVKERMTMHAVARRGYDVFLDDDMRIATISKGDKVYYATQFPLDGEANVSDARLRQVAGGREGVPPPLPPISPSASSPSAASSAGGSSEDGFGVLGRRGVHPS